jgi:hypothetical protein
VVWRLSDLWPFTGGCHYPGDCRRFEVECGCCPVLGSEHELDLSRDGFLARSRAYPGLDLTVVAPSRWIADKARRSSLFGARRIEHIATGVDLNVFAPHDRSAARASLGLPQDRTLILFGAFAATADRRKGSSSGGGAADLTCGAKCNSTLVVEPREEPLGDTFPLPVISVGRIDDQTSSAGCSPPQTCTLPCRR